MAAPTWVASAQTITSGGSEPTQTTSIALPTGWQEKDIFIMMVATSDGASMPDTPDGWKSVIPGGTVSGGFIAFWRRATASETDPVVTTRGSTGQRIGLIFAIRGCVGHGNPFDVARVTGSTSGTSITLPGLTTVTNDCLIVHLFGSGADNLTGQRMSALTNANLSSLTERVDQWTSTGGGVGVYVATGVKASAGATGNSTATCSASDAGWTMTIALKPVNNRDALIYTGPTFVARGTAVDTNVAATLNPSIPTGTQENDLMFLTTTRSGASVSVSGWTSAFASGAIAVFYKRAGASESAPNVVYSGTPINHCHAQIMTFRGCRTSGTPWSDISSAVADATSDTTRLAPAVDASFDQSLILHWVWDSLDNITGQRCMNPRDVDGYNTYEPGDHWTAANSGSGYACFAAERISAGTGTASPAPSIQSSAAATSTGLSLALPKDDGAHLDSASQFKAMIFG